MHPIGGRARREHWNEKAARRRPSDHIILELFTVTGSGRVRMHSTRSQRRSTRGLLGDYTT